MNKLAYLFLLILLASCSKENDNVIVCNDPQVLFISNSVYKYKLEIDDVYKTDIAGGVAQAFTLKMGKHKFKVTQLEGFLIFPTVKESTVTLLCDEKTQWRFP